jgi:hypothetical protein
MRLQLDGTPVGSIAIQQFTYNNTCHQRTITSSYLAKGLSQGQHTVSGTISGSGLPSLSASGDLGLVFFGD